MTSIAVITDVHADVQALRDALAQIDRLGIERIVCCGDVLDCGLFPEETLALLRERKVIAIRGNHDRWALNDGHDMSGWDLTSRSIAWLDALPTHWRTLIDDVRVVAVHARPESDMKGIAHDTPEHELEALLRDEPRHAAQWRRSSSRGRLMTRATAPEGGTPAISRASSSSSAATAARVCAANRRCSQAIPSSNTNNLSEPCRRDPLAAASSINPDPEIRK